MRKEMIRFFVILTCSGLLAGGCAKKENLRTEEPLAPVPKTSEAAPPGKGSTDKGDGVKEQSVKEPSQTAKQEPMKETVPSQATVDLERVYFDYNSYTLSPMARETLSSTAAYLLKKDPSVKVQIEGHCDERGADEYNMALGEKRARAAYEYLASLGVPAARLSTISYGEEKPAHLGQDEASWAKNRRVEFKVIK